MDKNLRKKIAKEGLIFLPVLLLASFCIVMGAEGIGIGFFLIILYAIIRFLIWAVVALEGKDRLKETKTFKTIKDIGRAVIFITILILFYAFFREPIRKFFHNYPKQANINTTSTQQATGQEGQRGGPWDYYSKEIAPKYSQDNYPTTESTITSANEAFNKGEEYFKNGNYDQAISEYTKVIELNPTDAAYNNRGNAYSNKGNLPQAISDYTKAIEINSNDAYAYCGRGLVYVKQGNFTQAISDYNKVIEINPNFAYIYSNRGVAYQGSKEYDKAILDLTKAIKINSNNAYAYYIRASCYIGKKVFNKAISDFDKAIELNPKYYNAYVLRAGVYVQEGKNYNQAIFDSSEAIKIDPNNMVAYCARGYAYLGKGNFDQAILDFNKAIELNPTNPTLNNVIATIYNEKAYAIYKKGESLDKGLELIDKAITMFPNNGIYLSTKAEILYKLGRYDEAYEYIKSGIKLEPNQKEIQDDFKMIEKSLNAAKKK